MSSELLKLPICPRCHETKNIKSYDYNETKMHYNFSHLAYKCESCNISWQFGRGIMEGPPCFPCGISVMEATATCVDIIKRQSSYAWTEYGVGILDHRRLFSMPLANFSDEEIKSVKQGIKEYYEDYCSEGE